MVEEKALKLKNKMAITNGGDLRLCTRTLTRSILELLHELTGRIPLVGWTSQPGFIMSTVRFLVQSSNFFQLAHWCVVELAMGTRRSSDH